MNLCPRCNKNMAVPPHALCDSCYLGISKKEEGASLNTNENLNQWREERKKTEEEKTHKWMDAIQSGLSVLFPLLGLYWVVFYFAFSEINKEDAAKLKVRGAIISGYMIIGVIIQFVVFKLYLGNFFALLAELAI